MSATPLILLDDIVHAIDPAPVAAKFGFAPDSDDYAELAALFADAPRARPKACCREWPVTVEGDRVRLGGTVFSSALLAENLAGQPRAWAYLATCGRELYDWARGVDDPFSRHLAEEALAQTLMAAMTALDGDFRRRNGEAKTANMNPGSLAEWPIAEQRPLFALMAEGAKATGVALEESLLMTPNKSVSGIRFFNEHGYVNCRLCPREGCPNRRAPRDLAAATHE